MGSERRIRLSKTVKILIGAAIAGVFLFIFLTSIFISLKLNMDFYRNRLNMNWWLIFTMDNAALLWCPLIAPLR
jgi:hypothetical protein